MARTKRIGVVLLTILLAASGFFFFRGNTKSEILISDRMSEFIDTVDRRKALYENKLIAFDLDDTVFMSSQDLGTPTWFYNMVNMLHQNGAALYEAYEVITKIDKIVQKQVKVVAVEQATLSAIRNWQKLDAIVVGLTSRPTDVAEITKMQLDEIGLDFSSPYFACVESQWNKKEGAFLNGVLFVGDHLTKGRVFRQLFNQLKKCGMNFKLIAYADDQQRYVTKIAKLAKRNGVDFIGIIYGGALSSRKFDLKAANRQLLELEASLDTAIIPEQYRTIFAVD